MNFLKIKLLVVAIVMIATSSAFASLGFDVTVDTSSLTSYGDGGYLYLQYTPLNGANSTVTLSNFQMGDNTGLNFTSAGTESAASGTLPGSLVFANTNGISDYNHQIFQFADKLSFNLAFSNPAAGGVAGGNSTFSLGLFYDAAGGSSIFGGATSGTLLTIDLFNDGTASVQTTQDIPTTVTPTPIPAAAWLLGSGLMGLVGIRRKNNV
jgi:hypothetical protein